MNRAELVSYIDTLLDSPSVKDYCPNGLQVEGKVEIRHIVTGVTACLELIEAAAERNADAVLVHHGILWGGHMPRITRSFRARIKALLDADLNLIAYHLPLDRHLEVGNGATVAQRLGLVDVEGFCAHRGIMAGVKGRADAPISTDALVHRIRETLDSEPVVIPGGPDPIRTIGVVTGAADKDLPQAIEAGLDCYITGEISEYVMHFAKEEGITFIAAGHHATERWGVQALGDHLAAHTDVTCEFVDVPNPA